MNSLQWIDQNSGKLALRNKRFSSYLYFSVWPRIIQFNVAWVIWGQSTKCLLSSNINWISSQEYFKEKLMRLPDWMRREEKNKKEISDWYVQQWIVRWMLNVFLQIYCMTFIRNSNWAKWSKTSSMITPWILQQEVQ